MLLGISQRLQSLSSKVVKECIRDKEAGNKLSRAVSGIGRLEYNENDFFFESLDI